MRKFFLLAATLLGSAAANAQIIFHWNPTESRDSILANSKNLRVETRDVLIDTTVVNTKCIVINGKTTLEELLACGLGVIVKSTESLVYRTSRPEMYSLLDLAPLVEQNPYESDYGHIRWPYVYRASVVNTDVSEPTDTDDFFIDTFLAEKVDFCRRAMKEVQEAAPMI